MIKRIGSNPYVVESCEGISFDPSCKDSRSVTQQSFVNDVDINNIVAKYVKTGVLGNVDDIRSRKGVFLDVSNVDSFKTALDRVTAINDAFMSLPADIRSRFGHDPQNLISFMSDSNNASECVKMGLLTEEDIVKVPVKDIVGKVDDAGAKSAPVAPPAPVSAQKDNPAT